jgi:hypothetical protein
MFVFLLKQITFREKASASTGRKNVRRTKLFQISALKRNVYFDEKIALGVLHHH